MAYATARGRIRRERPAGPTQFVQERDTNAHRRKRKAGFQDRLVTELRLAGVATIGEANEVLWDFLPRFNQQFGAPPQQFVSAYRPVEPDMPLDEILSFKYRRKVATNTVQIRAGKYTRRRTPGLLPSQLEVIQRHGIPLALYSDRHAVFKHPREPRQSSRADPVRTRDARAWHTADLRAISGSERPGGADQRHIPGPAGYRATLRLAGVATMGEANKVLWDFLPRFNQQLRSPAATVCQLPAGRAGHAFG